MQLIYIKGKFLKLNNKDFYCVLKLLKESLIQKLSKEIDYKNIEKIKYLKWCYDKLLLNDNNSKTSILKPGSICWVDFGQNVGSELRKLRPAILWRSSADKKMWKLFFEDQVNLVFVICNNISLFAYTIITFNVAHLNVVSSFINA